jgi:hypothetical protein
LPNERRGNAEEEDRRQKDIRQKEDIRSRRKRSRRKDEAGRTRQALQALQRTVDD